MLLIIFGFGFGGIGEAFLPAWRPFIPTVRVREKSWRLTFLSLDHLIDFGYFDVMARRSAKSTSPLECDGQRS